MCCDGRSVDAVKPAQSAQDVVGGDRRDQAQEEREQGRADELPEGCLVEFYAALEPDSQQQVDGERIVKGVRQSQVAANQRSDDAQHERQYDRREEVGSEDVYVLHAALLA